MRLLQVVTEGKPSMLFCPGSSGLFLSFLASLL